MSGSPWLRPLVRAAAVAITTTAASVAINYATGWTSNLWAWLAVAVLTLVATVLALQSSRPARSKSEEPGEAASRIGIVRNITVNAPSVVQGQGTQYVHMDLRDGHSEAPPQ